MNLSRVALASASVALSAGLLAGCGGGTSPAPSQPGSSATSVATPAASESSPAMGGTIPAATFTSRVLAAMQDARTMRMTATINGKEAETADIVFADGAFSTHAKVSTQASGMEIISLRNGAEVYLKAAALGLPDWTKIDENSSNPIVKAMATQLKSMQSALDPASAIRHYEKADDFTLAGTETIDGVETTKFTSSMPAAVVLEQMGLGSLGGAAADEKVAVEISVDKDFRPIRSTNPLTLQGTPTTVVQNYSDFGTDITITAP